LWGAETREGALLGFLIKVELKLFLGIRLPCRGVARANAACERTNSLSLLFRGVQNETDGARERLPFRLFGGKLLAAGSSEAIVTSALTLVGKIPRGCDPALGLEPMQCRIERAGFDLQEIFGSALNVFGDGVAVAGASQ
jgi:hypothetical protein